MTGAKNGSVRVRGTKRCTFMGPQSSSCSSVGSKTRETNGFNGEWGAPLMKIKSACLLKCCIDLQLLEHSVA